MEEEKECKRLLERITNMLKKICDNCGKEIENFNDIEEENFFIQVFDETETERNWIGDLCEECKSKILDEMAKMMNNYNIHNEAESEKEE